MLLSPRAQEGLEPWAGLWPLRQEADGWWGLGGQGWGQVADWGGSLPGTLAGPDYDGHRWFVVSASGSLKFERISIKTCAR